MKMTRQTAADLVANAHEEEVKLILAEACRRSLKFHTELFWPELEPNRDLVHGWLLDAVDEHLVAVSEGEIRRLLITVPPGSMKSLKTRVFWPTWEWTHRPATRYLGFSYAEALATRDNRRARQIIESQLYRSLFPEVQLSRDQAAKTNFQNTKTGSMMVAGVGGKATGERGDRVIVDDPHNVSESESEKIRQATVAWFREVLPSRVNDLQKDAFIVIQQRVHYDDVANAAIELGYDHLNVPAHFDEAKKCYTVIGWEDPRTEDGDNFWPDRYPDVELDLLKEALGAYAFSSQYEQSATPREGGLFKVGKLREIPDVPKEDGIVWADAWDLAGTDEKENRDAAYTARVRIGYVPRTRRYVIANADRRRISVGAVEEWLSLARDEVFEEAQDGADIRMVLPQDPAQAGKAQKRNLALLLGGVNFYFEIQSGDKETRASPFAAQVENGNVDIVVGPWNTDFVEELRQFPRGRFKDQADAAASGFNRVAPVRRRPTSLSAVGSVVKNRANPT